MNRIIAGLLALFLAAPAVAQVNPSNLPANTVFGRLGIGPGPGQAIPFAVLTNSLLSNNLGFSLAAGGPATFNFNGSSLQPYTFAAPALTLSGRLSAPTLGETILLLDSYGTNANGTVVFSKVNGTPALPTATQNQDILGILSTNGWGATGRTTQGCTIQFRAEQNYTDTVWGTSMGYYCVPIGGGAANITELLRMGPGLSPALTQTTNGIGAGSVSVGFSFRNTTAAAAGAQQNSPSSCWTAQGWKTNATAASQPVDWCVTNTPVQGAASPSTALTFSSQINNGGFVRAGSFVSGGAIDAAVGYTIGGGAASSGHVLRGNGTNYVDGQLSCADLSNSAAGCSVIPARIQVIARAVNFNSANTDTTIAVAIPAGATNYQVNQVRIANASASISTATWGLFSAAAGGGTAIFAGGQTITVTTAAANTNNNSMTAAPANQNTQSFNFANLFFRVGTAQGSTATADVIIDLEPL